MVVCVGKRAKKPENRRIRRDMEQYKKEFIEFMIDCNVLKFGDFVTKSGRKTPFFVNTGFYRTGAQLKRLGEYYAEAINAEFGLDFDVLFGPAYKGIPLTVATTMSIAEMYDEDIKYCSNRKEVKDHGDKGILKFGDFVTKSGRKTPFFVNTGFYRTGAQLKRLGEYYAEAINAEFGLDFDVLFGPAYKGIPLTVATTMSIAEMYDEDIKYCSNRKEVKDHGDKGILLGSPIEDGDKVVIIEDVTTAGTSIQETLPIIKAQGDVDVMGLVVSVDRMERGQGEKSALTEIEENYGIKTTAIVTMAEVVEHLYNREYKGRVIIDDTLKAAIDAYYDQYGVK